jgi:hypothetical protein
VNNTAPCTDDGDPCTADLCNADVCDHSTFTTSACATDNDVCTADFCDGAGTCAHTPISCGTPFTINSFNGGWNSTLGCTGLTKPDNHTECTAGTAGNLNPEGGTIIYVFVSGNTYTINMSITQPATPQSLNGLTNLQFVMSGTTGSEGMVKVGLSSSATVGDATPGVWTEKALTGYVTFTGSANTQYKTFNIPLADFVGANLVTVNQVRVQFVAVGANDWRIDNIAAN